MGLGGDELSSKLVRSGESKDYLALRVDGKQAVLLKRNYQGIDQMTKCLEMRGCSERDAGTSFCLGAGVELTWFPRLIMGRKIA